MFWDARQVGVTFRCIFVPLKYGIDSLGKLCIVGFINTAFIYPEVLDPSDAACLRQNSMCDSPLLCCLISFNMSLNVTFRLSGPCLYERVEYYEMFPSRTSVNSRLPSCRIVRRRMCRSLNTWSEGWRNINWELDRQPIEHDPVRLTARLYVVLRVRCWLQVRRRWVGPHRVPVPEWVSTAMKCASSGCLKQLPYFNINRLANDDTTE